MRGSVAYPDPGSGAFLTPGSGMGKKIRSGSRFGMNNTDNISESLETIFWVKILKFFDADPGSGMEKFDPGSGINIPDPQHWYAALLALPFIFMLLHCLNTLLFSVDNTVTVTRKRQLDLKCWCSLWFTVAKSPPTTNETEFARELGEVNIAHWLYRV